MKKILSLLLAFTIATSTNLATFSNVGMVYAEDGEEATVVEETVDEEETQDEEEESPVEEEESPVEDDSSNEEEDEDEGSSIDETESEPEPEPDSVTGTTNDGLGYTIDNTANPKTVTINTYDVSKNTVVVIPDMIEGITVTSIDNGIFKSKGITKITISATAITSIPDNMFQGCESLTDVTLHSGIETIGVSAFQDCTSLTKITLPIGLKEIKSSAFKGCTSLTSITIPSNFETLGATPFEGCTKLTEITFNGKAPTVTGSTLTEVLGKSATLKFASDDSSTGWSAFVEAHEATGNSSYVNSSATQTLKTPTIEIKAPSTRAVEPIIGDTLVVSVEGVDDLASAGYTIQWIVNGTNVTDATNTEYTVKASDEGKIKVSVTVPGGAETYKAGTFTSAETSVVSDGKVSFPSLKFDISSPYYGDTLTVSSDIGLESYAIKWEVGGKEINGHTSTSLDLLNDKYTDTNDDKIDFNASSQKIKASVIIDSDNTEYKANTYSVETSTIKSAAMDFVILVNGSVSDSAKAGDTLTVQVENQGIATIAEIPTENYTVTWYVEGSLVGTTGYNFQIPSDADGKEIRAVVKVTNSDYGITEKTKTIGVLSNVPAVKFDKQVPRIGDTINVTFADESSISTNIFEISWSVDGSPLDVDNTTSFTISADNIKDYLNKTITATVKAKDNQGYTDESSSIESQAVQLPLLPQPTITITDEDGEVDADKIKVGDTLTVSVEGISFEGTYNYSIQWYTYEEPDNGSSASSVPGGRSDGLTAIDKATDNTLELDGNLEGKQIVVGVTPTSANESYAEEESYSQKTNPVGNADGKIALTGIEIDYNEEGTHLIITKPESVEWDEDGDFDFQWHDGDGEISGATESTYELSDEDISTGATFYVIITPSAGNSKYTVIPATSNKLTIKQSLPDIKITLNENDLDVPTDTRLKVGEVLAVSLDEMQLTSDFYIEWLVDEKVVKQGIYDGTTENIDQFTIDYDHLNYWVSVRITNRKEDSDYNNSPKTQVIGRVQNIQYAVEYIELDGVTTTDSTEKLQHGSKHEFTLEVTDSSKLALPKTAEEIAENIIIKMGDESYTGFNYNPSTGLVEIPKVTGKLEITAKAVTKDPSVGENTPRIALDNSDVGDSMYGIKTSHFTLYDDDLNGDYYEFTLTATHEGNTLPDNIQVKFKSTMTMTLADDSVNYIKNEVVDGELETATVQILAARFNNTNGYNAEIIGIWDDASGNTNTPLTDAEGAPLPDVTEFDVTVELDNTSVGVASISPKTETIESGDELTITLTLEDGYRTIESLTLTIGDETLSSTKYKVNGNVLTINAGVLTEECTIVVKASSKEGTSTEYGISYFTSYGGAIEGIYSTYIELKNDGYSIYEGESLTFEVSIKDAYKDKYDLDKTFDITGTHGTIVYDFAEDMKSAKVTVPNVKSDLDITIVLVDYVEPEPDPEPDPDPETDDDPDTGTGPYDITLTLTSGIQRTDKNSTEVESGDEFTASFKITDTDKYYALTKNSFTVTPSTFQNSLEFSEKDGVYTITIPKVTADITLKVSTYEIKDENTISFSAGGLTATNFTSSNNYQQVIDSGTKNYILTIKPSTGYTLPEKVISIKGDNIGNLALGDDYTYSISSDGNTLTLTILEVLDDIVITMQGVIISDEDDDSSGDGGSGDGDNNNDDDSSSKTTYDIKFVDATGLTFMTLTTGTDKKLSYLPSLTTSDGTIFLGWYTSSSGGSKITTSTVFSGNITIYPRTVSVTTPQYDGNNGQYQINTSSSSVAIYADKLNGGTITVTGTSTVDNFIIVPPYNDYVISSTTSVVLPDGNGNQVTWTIPAGAVIDDDNYLNLGLIVRETPINTSTSLGRSLGYVDFTHVGDLTANNAGLTVTFRMYTVSTGDTIQLYKLNDSNEMVGSYVSASAIGNNYVRATMYNCSRWEVIARNYTYNPDGSGGSGSYTKYYNIPSSAYIPELRNVQLNQVIDLTKINLGNGIIIEGWYYDQLYTNKVSNPSYVVVTEAIIKTGLYPKTYQDYVTPDYGNPWPDYGNNFNPDLSDNPSTNTKTLVSLF